jgi:hypothetical protein
MLEPETCDKYISWDDVEIMMREHVRRKLGESVRSLYAKLKFTTEMIIDCEQKIKEQPNDNSLKLSLKSFEDCKIELIKQIKNVYD